MIFISETEFSFQVCHPLQLLTPIFTHPPTLSSLHPHLWHSSYGPTCLPLYFRAVLSPLFKPFSPFTLWPHLQTHVHLHTQLTSMSHSGIWRLPPAAPKPPHPSPEMMLNSLCLPLHGCSNSLVWGWREARQRDLAMLWLDTTCPSQDPTRKWVITYDSIDKLYINHIQ